MQLPPINDESSLDAQQTDKIEMGEKELGRWLRVASTIISILLGIIAFGVTYSIRQLDDRIAKIEHWREKHEEKAEQQMLNISQSLARIETVLDIKPPKSTQK